MKGRKINASLLTPSIVISVLLLLPFFFLFIIGVSGNSEVWEHVSRFLLSNYVLNTILILVSVSILSLLWGVLPAYLISNFKFPGSRFFFLDSYRSFSYSYIYHVHHLFRYHRCNWTYGIFCEHTIS